MRDDQERRARKPATRAQGEGEGARARADDGSTGDPWYDSLTLLDDEYMALFFRNAVECAQVTVATIIGRDDLTVTSVRTHVDIPGAAERSAQLDVLARDARGHAYDVEVQRDPRGANPRRARFYASTLDLAISQKGTRAAELPDAWVVFVCEGDGLGRGLPRADVERCVAQDGGAFGDGSHVVYLDATRLAAQPAGEHRAQGAGVSAADARQRQARPSLADLMHDFTCSDPAKMRIRSFARRAREMRSSGEERVAMNEVKERMLREAREEGIAKGLEQGRERGREEMGAEVARRLAAAGMPAAEIARLCDLTSEQVGAILSRPHPTGGKA